jgi:hypothetical protein
VRNYLTLRASRNHRFDVVIIMTTTPTSSHKTTPRLSYADTDIGITLPVLDVTHPLFTSSIDEAALAKQSMDGLKHTKTVKKLPPFLMRLLGRYSFIMAGFFLRDEKNAYLDGMSTLFCKLGPYLIPKGWRFFLDRKISKGSVPIRMRARDISICLAEALVPQLQAEAKSNICLFNIGGGAASDSINALFLTQEKSPLLLKNRKIEIDALDIDTFGPHFAERSITSLLSPGGRLHGLDVTFRHVQYDWRDPAVLREVLLERKDWIQICSSEGGLFEYASDEEIIANLKVIFDDSATTMRVAGSIFHEGDRVNPAVCAMIEATGIKVRYLGFSGLKYLLAGTKWELEKIMDTNPTYGVFTLRKTAA